MQHDYETHFSQVILFARQVAEMSTNLLQKLDGGGGKETAVLVAKINALRSGATPPAIVHSLHEMRGGANPVVHNSASAGGHDFVLKRELLEATLFVATYLATRCYDDQRVFNRGHALRSWYDIEMQRRVALIRPRATAGVGSYSSPPPSYTEAVAYPPPSSLYTRDSPAAQASADSVGKMPASRSGLQDFTDMFSSLMGMVRW